MPDKVASSTWSTSDAIQLGSPTRTHAESAGMCANYGAYITICQPSWNRAGKLIKDRQGKKYPRSVRSEPPRGRTRDKLEFCLNFLPFSFHRSHRYYQPQRSCGHFMYFGVARGILIKWVLQGLSLGPGKSDLIQVTYSMKTASSLP